MAGVNYFQKLNAINVNEHTERKNGLTYLSWAWAWQELKLRYPDAQYTIYENADGLFYHTDGRTCWVKTGVTVKGIEHIEYLPVMDARNKSIPLEAVTSTDVNKAIQRSLTKSVARHGLGLYLYSGEDIPYDGVKYATATQVKAVAAKARKLKLEPLDVFERLGGKPGERLTLEMFDAAMKYLGELEGENNCMEVAR